MRIQHRLEEHRGTAEVGQVTSISHPDHHDANIQTAWRAAVSLWPAWFDTLGRWPGLRMLPVYEGGFLCPQPL